MADPILKIGGVDKTSLLKVNTVTYERALNRRGDMNCLLTVGNGYRPVVGQPVIVSQDGADRWGGIIEDLEESAEPGTDQLVYGLKCADWWRFLDKRLYAGDIGGESLRSAMTRLAAVILTEEGFSIAGVPNPGPTITNVISFNYQPVSDVLNRLTQITGYFCQISAAKVITFSLYASNPAPFSLSWISGNWSDLKIRRSMNEPGFRNRQIVRSQYAVTSEVTENFVGDNSTYGFFVAQFMTALTSVTVGGVPQTMGVFGVDGPPNASFTGYYIPDGTAIYFYVAGTTTPNPPGIGVPVVVVYVGPYRNLVIAENTSSITARAAIEGGSGKWESISEERNVSDANMLVNLADGLLRANDDIATLIGYASNSDKEPLADSLNPGHRQAINMTAGPHNVNGTFLVETVRSRWVRTADSEGDIWEHEVTATDGEPFLRPDQVLQRILEVARIGPDSATAANESQIDGGSPATLQYGPTTVTLTTNTTINAPVASPQVGALYFLEVVQGAGPYTITWGSGFGSGVPTDIDDAAGSITRYVFIAKADNLFYRWNVPATGN